MFRRVGLVLLAIGAMLFGNTIARAEGISDYGIAVGGEYNEYSMLLDKVEGANIETFYIERPDEEALAANIINASQFGLNVNNEDNYEAFQSALNYCRDNPNTYLVIDQGIYYFKTNDSLRLTGLKNVLIDGNDSEFIFETQKQFVFSECDGVELRNLIVDWNWAKDRVASLVRVRNKKPNSFEIEFLELEDVDTDIPLVSFQQYDSREFVPGSYGSYKTFSPIEVPGSIVGVEKLEPNVLRIDISSSFTTSFHNEEVYILRHYTYGGAVFTVNGNSSNITFNNVKIYGSAGMGYVFGDKSHHFQIINSYIGLRPGNEDKQRMATSADGIHILNTDGFFRIDNCDLSYTGDDIINVHDDMLKVTQINSKNELKGYVTGGFVQKGDRIRIYNLNLEDIGFETEVTNFTRSGYYGTITLKDELPAEVDKGFFVYRSSSSTHNYVISNNYIHETKGRAALLKASDALFENNRMYRTVSECIEVQVDISELDNKIWYEGIGSRNVVVNNNVFDECAFGGKATIIKIDCDRGDYNNVHSDVHITNNAFYSCFGATITADNVTDLYIENNCIFDCGDIIISDNCVNVEMIGNDISYPSATCPHTDTKRVLDRLPGCYEYGSTGKIYCNECHTIIDHNYKGIPPIKGHRFVAVTSDSEGMTGKYHMCSVCRELEAHNCDGEGGSCSVCGHGAQAEVTWLSLELDTEKVDYIGINLYIDAPTGIVFYIDGKMAEPVMSEDGSLFKLCYKSAPKELADTHILTAKNSENVAVNINNASEYCFSGEMYCRYVLAAGNGYSDKLKNVCNSLAGYSRQARMYFDYNNDELEESELSENIELIDYEMKATGTLPEELSYIGSSLILGDELILRHYFAGDGSGLEISCNNSQNNNEQSNNSRNINSFSVTEEYLSQADITCIDIRVPYSCVGDMTELNIAAEGYTEPYILSYGVLTYCQNVYETSGDCKLINLCNALYNFSEALLNYE